MRMHTNGFTTTWQQITVDVKSTKRYQYFRLTCDAFGVDGDGFGDIILNGFA